MTITQEPSMPSLTSLDSNPLNLFTDPSRAAEEKRKHLASVAMQKFYEAQQERWRQERQWYYNMAFYFGQHHLKWRNPQGAAGSAGNFDLWLPPAPYWKVRPVINQVRKVARREMARLTAQKPNAFVIPASTEDRDVFAASAAEQIWDSTYRKIKLNHTLRQAAFWQTICGNGFTKQWWDDDKLDELNGVAGDVQCVAETPFHIYVPDLREVTLEGQPWMIHAKVVPLDWAREQYGVEARDKDLNVVDESMLSVMGISSQVKRNSTIMLEFYAKPSGVAEFKQGGMFKVVARQIVEGYEWPIYSHGQYPFTKLDAIPTGKFYNESIIVDLIPLQQELNRTRGQIIESKNKMGKPQLLAERGSVDAHRITSEPGQVIAYKPGFNPPTPLALQNLPAYITEEVNRLYADISDLSGQHEVSEGKAPPGVTAAVAISYLQEQDETLMSAHFASMEEAIEKLGKQILCYVRDNWTEERTIQTVGLDRTFDVLTFKGSDINNNTDLKIEAGSALPQSRAAKQAFITDLMKMGFIPPEKGLEVLEIGGLNRIYEEVQVDRRQAQRENLKMRQITIEDIEAFQVAWDQKPEHQKIDQNTGELLPAPLPIPVNNYDNHGLHIEEHNRYRKSQSFETAPPHVKALFDLHVKHHEMALMAPKNIPGPTSLGQPLGEGVESVPGPGPAETQVQSGGAPAPGPMPGEDIQPEQEVGMQ